LFCATAQLATSSTAVKIMACFMLSPCLLGGLLSLPSG
jgi:hypothetical protein